MNKPSTLIYILLSVGLFYTFTSLQYNQAKALSATASEYKNVLDNISRIAASRDELLEAYKTIPKEQMDRLAKILPDNIDVVGLALDLDSIASKYGISIDSVAVESEAQDQSNLVLPEYAKPYDKASVSFTFVSNYENFMKLLSDLEKSLRIMDVQSTSFRINESGNLYEHKVTVETYWLK